MSASLTFLYEPSDALPVVDLWLCARTGAMHDPEGKEGALNLALRTLVRGAGGLDGDALEAELDALGAEFSASAEVSTAVVHAAVLQRNLDRFLDLFVAMVTRPTLSPAEVERAARTQRADLIDSRDDDRTLAGRHFRRQLFKGHPFGRPSSGTPATLPKLTAEDARAVYERTFVPDNLVLGAVGAITPAQAEALAQRLAAALPQGPAPDRFVAAPTRPQGRHLVLVDKPERTQTQVLIGTLGTRADDRDHAALTVANTVFGGTFTARLMREVRTKRGWSYGASSRLYRDRERDAWSMWTFPAAKDSAACIALQLKMLEQFHAKGPTAREVEFARKFLVRGRAFEFETATRRLWLRLDERIHELGDGYHHQLGERLARVGVEPATKAFRKRIDPKSLLFSVVATARERRAELEAAIPDLDRVTVVPYDTD